MTHPEREKEGGRVVLVLVLVLGLLAGGGYAAAYAGAGDKVPRGTSVAGVGIGGLTHDEAVTTLREGLVGRANDRYSVSAGGQTRRFRPAEAGLAVDYQASVAAAGAGRSWEPARLWDYYTDGDELPAVVDIEESSMTAFVDELAAGLGTPPRDGDVKFRGAQVRVTDPRRGERVDPESARSAIEAAYLAEGDEADVELELRPVDPEIDGADVRRAVEEFANPAVSSPVTLRFGDVDLRLRPRDYVRTLRLDAEDGQLVPAVDRKALARLVRSRISTDGRPVDASFRIVDGRPRVVPARVGVRYRPADLADAFLQVVARPDGDRVHRVGASAARPDFTTRDARALRIKERVSTFTTYYPDAEYRNVNIGRAAELVDGTVLEPGEVFSLNGIVGERTRANGFTEGYIISDGILKQDLGGGVSQLATTLFNAMFFAGLEDVEHKPHSFYIDRYPVGREATVAWGAVDLRFRNDSRYGVLVKARVEPSTPSTSGVVTVDMWSTKRWDITTRASDRYNRTQPETRRVDSRRCTPNDGYGGFDIDVWRYFRRPGSDALRRTEKFHTTYTPSDTVVCTNPDSVAG